MFSARAGFASPPGRLVGSPSTNASLTWTSQNGCTTEVEQKKFGTASMFVPDASTERYIYTTDSGATFANFGTADFTVECFIYIPTGITYTREADVMAVNTSGAFGFRLGRQFNDTTNTINGLNVYARFQADLDFMALTFTRDVWNFIVIQRKSAVMSYWFNGSALSYTAQGAGARNFASKGASDRVTVANTTTSPFPGIKGGYIDEFCFSNVARYDPSAPVIPIPTEAFYVDQYTTQLLHMDGTDGGSTFTNATS